MPGGSITLGQVAAHTATLAVACSRCDRAGRYSLDTMIAKHGPQFGIPDLLRLLSADCPKRQSVKGLVMKARKFSARTPAGLFGKAALVSRTGSAAAIVALTLADDLLNSAELRKAVWPAADQRGSNSS